MVSLSNQEVGRVEGWWFTELWPGKGYVAAYPVLVTHLIPPPKGEGDDAASPAA